MFTLKDNYNNTALHLSAENGHLNTVQWLIDKGLEIDATSRTYPYCNVKMLTIIFR